MIIVRGSDTWKSINTYLDGRIAGLRDELESGMFGHTELQDAVRRELIREFIELTHLGEDNE